jgi:hypothetical protein
MKAIHHLLWLVCLCLFSASCANQANQESAPVEEAPKQTTISSVERPTQQSPRASDPSATKLFRTPSDDITLPTDAQIAEGTETSQVQAPVEPNNAQPSISIKPPAAPVSVDKP